MYISFSFILFLRRIFIYFPLHVHVYIRASGPLMNTSAIRNIFNFFRPCSNVAMSGAF
jgi:hypothetical protein